MKRLLLPIFVSLCFSCGEVATSEQSYLSPRSETFVVTGRYTIDSNLLRRLSLIMPPDSIELLTLEGTNTLDKIGLAVKGKTFINNGYEHILSTDFKALRSVKRDGSAYGPFDLLDYETNRKVGGLNYWSGGSRYILSELCTGTAETLCVFNFDQEKNQFGFEFVPQPVTEGKNP